MSKLIIQNIGVEIGLDLSPCGQGDALALGRVFGDPQEFSREGLDIPFGDEKSCLLVFYEFRNPRVICAEHRKPGRHRLHEGNRNALHISISAVTLGSRNTCASRKRCLTSL